ncbi:LOW QUALITY PROTEIN: centromere protein X [Fukomys damarensis]|uniref:LOW QUALITY PROTEIN: centromere protein X n=1 Tax=Fukomys damarensis TaxID=885580 RepID=UPI00145519CF|nr:LOW QUALITY PROTEIN: centromere protein X [Fukomys damarensis]
MSLLISCYYKSAVVLCTLDSTAILILDSVVTSKLTAGDLLHAKQVKHTAAVEGASTSFLKELVSRWLHLHFRDEDIRVSGHARLLLKISVVEVAVHGMQQAQGEDAALLGVDQVLENVLPQLLLDF